MTSVVFEAATLKDGLNKAERISPSTGDAAVKYGGIILEIHPDQSYAIVRSTNFDVWYHAYLDVIDISGPKTIWRLPAKSFAGIVNAMPSGHEKFVTLDQVKNQIVMTCSGRKTKAVLNLIDLTSYSMWSDFDDTNMVTVPELGSKMNLVDWACSSTEQQLGLRLTPEAIYATDHHRLARTVLHPSADFEPITLPPRLLRGVIPPIGEPEIRVEKGLLLIKPDDYSQIKVRTIDAKFPDQQRVIEREYSTAFDVYKSELAGMVKMVTGLSSKDNTLSLRLYIGAGELVAYIGDQSVGTVQDQVDVSGVDDLERSQFNFNADLFIEAINNCPSEVVTIRYEPGNYRMPWFIDDGENYQVWVVGRNPKVAH